MIRGWNWGQYTLGDKAMEFEVDGKPSFEIPYSEIALSTASGKNEVAFEFRQEDASKKGDMLCEMRFHIPAGEIDKYYESRKAQLSDDDNSDEDQLTAAKVFNDKITAKANLGQNFGTVVACIQDLPMLIPRGNYSLEFFDHFAKLHGKTHDYKLAFKDINKIFLLQKPDGQHMVYLL